MKNQDIRYAIKTAGVRYWQVAAEIGITDGNFSRALRFELPPEKKQLIFKAIERLEENQ